MLLLLARNSTKYL